MSTWSERIQQRVRYTPVMKFVPTGDGKQDMHCMTFRGHSGWSWPLAGGTLTALLPKYLRHIGTDQFFALI